MGTIEVYRHHGKHVSVDSELKGKHRQHCLCYRCKRFHPGSEVNCAIAALLYNLCKLQNLVTPVYECSSFDCVCGKETISFEEEGEKCQ